MSRSGLLAASIMVTAVLGAAQAQGNRGPNGGIIVTTQGHPIEFVYKDQDLRFYVGDDDGSPLSTEGMQGRAFVVDGGKVTTISLTPATPNLMTGQVPAPLGSKARVVFTATLHGHTLTARYVVD